MGENGVYAFDNAIGKVFRHKRLFNYVVSPLANENGIVKCQVGKNIFKNIPMDYFKRDWKRDDSLTLEKLLSDLENYDDETPFTSIYTDKYEIDDGQPHSYIHFNDDDPEKFSSFPKWILSTCTKEKRDKTINPYTMILAVKDGMAELVQEDLDIMNQMRKENEFIMIDDFTGFEMGLIKYLEKKYMREI